MNITLSIGGRHYGALYEHLFPGDRREGVVLLLCGRGTGSDRQRLIVQRIIPIPHDQVELREPDRLVWSVETFLLPLVTEIEAKELSLIVMHCHPGGFPSFSAIDDEGDRELFPSVHSWLDKPVVHGSAVMLPDGSIFARVVGADGTFSPITSVAIAGDRLRFFPEVLSLVKTPEHGFRMSQAFGEQTYARLQNLRVAVIGCSGTGGIVVELLARCGVRNLVLVDPDRVTVKNLDRILNAQMRHAEAGSFKVDMLGDAVEAFGLGVTVERHATSILDPAAAAAVASADIVFGCVDSVEGRHVLTNFVRPMVSPTSIAASISSRTAPAASLMPWRRPITSSPGAPAFSAAASTPPRN